MVRERRFTVVPAIDLIDGRCVRLHQGDYERKTEYPETPSAVAEQFSSFGATRLHVVDLDAARGSGHNREAVDEIRRAFPGILEVGGGVRSADDVEGLLRCGVDRIVLGTVFSRNPDRVVQWIERFGQRFVAGIDARDGVVRVAGWLEDDGVSDIDAAQRAAELGFLSIIYTNISRDGTGTGPDMDRTVLMARNAGIPVIASGGVGSAEHIARAAESLAEGVVGIIAGKAIYDERLDLAETLRRYPGADRVGMNW